MPSIIILTDDKPFINHIPFIIQYCYKIGSLHKTKGQNSSIINYHLSKLRQSVYLAAYMIRYGMSPLLHIWKKYYNTMAFSCPTRNRVLTMMSYPASSMFLQKATSSEHMSTNSLPLFPRILWSSLLKKGYSNESRTSFLHAKNPSPVYDTFVKFGIDNGP